MCPPVDDFGIEVLKKAAEEMVPGDKSDYYLKVGIVGAVDIILPTEVEIKNDIGNPLPSEIVVSGNVIDPRDRNWNLDELTDAVTAHQGGVWDINDITGTVSLPTGAATEAKQDAEIAQLVDINTELDAHTVQLTDINTELNTITAEFDETQVKQDAQTAELVAINSELDAVNLNLDSIETKLDAANSSLDAIEADADAIRIATQSIDTDFDVALSTRASEATLAAGFTAVNLNLDSIEVKLDTIDSSIDSGFTAVNLNLDSIEVKLDTVHTDLNAVNLNLDSIEVKLDTIDTSVNAGFTAVNLNLDSIETKLDAANTSLDAIEADADAIRIATQSIDTDFDVALSTRASEATLSALSAKVANDYGASSGAIRTASQIGNTTGAANFNAGVTGAQTLRTTSNITRNGTELSYNDGASDANTIRTSSNIQRDGNDLAYSFGTVDTNTLRTASIPGNATGIADFNAGTTGAQTPRVTANITRNGTELDYDIGDPGANTPRVAAMLGGQQVNGSYVLALLSNLRELRISDICDSALDNAALTVTSSAQEIRVSGAALANRKIISVYNNSFVNMFIGDSGVTTVNGTHLGPGDYFKFRAGPNLAVYIVVASGSHNARIMEAS